jgi:hypothetical protein
MSNSTRWRRLMEWIRYLQDTGQDICLKDLVDRVNEIKEGK